MEAVDELVDTADSEAMVELGVTDTGQLLGDFVVVRVLPKPRETVLTLLVIWLAFGSGADDTTGELAASGLGIAALYRMSQRGKVSVTKADLVRSLARCAGPKSLPRHLRVHIR